jgi:hypothetical protein
MDGYSFLKIKSDFYNIVHLNKYTGLANIVDRVNESTAMNRLTMDSMWDQCSKHCSRRRVLSSIPSYLSVHFFLSCLSNLPQYLHPLVFERVVATRTSHPFCLAHRTRIHISRNQGTLRSSPTRRLPDSYCGDHNTRRSPRRKGILDKPPLSLRHLEERKALAGGAGGRKGPSCQAPGPC